MARNTRDPFNAPIPGESLTKTPGGAPYEKPPQFADPRMAAEYVWQQMTTSRSAAMVKTLLNRGASAESIATTVLRQGFNNGQWTPDTALIMSKPVLGMVTAVGRKAGAKNIKVMEDDFDLQEFFIDSGSLDEDFGGEQGTTGPLEEEQGPLTPEQQQEEIQFRGPLGGGQ